MAKILLVEDDKNSGFLIQKNLKSAGYEVTLAQDGMKGLECFRSEHIDLCVLDIMLPKRDGLSLAREIRKEKDVPFIFLSARALDEDKIEGFKIGCDDYITKPFNLEELLLRINVVLNRKNRVDPDDCMQNDPVTIGSALFYPVDRVLMVDKQQSSLSAKEAALLAVFCMARNQVVSRRDILMRVWSKDDYYASKSLDVYLTKLRRLLKEIEGVTLQNVHGFGYKLIEKSAESDGL
jgi:DNA-binding response OmpR family regulator